MFPLSVLKILFFFSAWLALWIPIAIPLTHKINYQFPQIPTLEQKLILVVSLYTFAPIILGLMIKWDNQSWLSIGWQWQLKELVLFAQGLILALSSIIIIFALEFATGLINWQGKNSSGLLALILPVFFLGSGISWVEELIFRGFLINQLMADFPLWGSAIASSTIFALLHLVWERQKTIPQLPGLWLMGMVLIAARILVGGDLALAWGLHTGWILGLSCVDGAELIDYNTDHKNWLTGIDRQPLAGVFGILGLSIVGCWLLVVGFNY